MEETQFKTLEGKINELIALCQQLKDENTALLKSESEWQSERAKLLGRNEDAMRQIDAMILRLKNLEQNA